MCGEKKLLITTAEISSMLCLMLQYKAFSSAVPPATIALYGLNNYSLGFTATPRMGIKRPIFMVNILGHTHYGDIDFPNLPSH
ncbi:hypothetical protein XELAEV_18013739mg [Xenopus laevis]|uniref:Uncharacterized protein n=1 Tax=Xenopus laevis TaxID=8355 RepID=A0A974DSG7_XENLA|nr:hypothetical protein XELAEV_18013739mg [Xenopus laevis]